MTYRFALAALVAGALTAACGEVAAPAASTVAAPTFSNGRKLGQCFLQLELDGADAPSDANGATVTADAGLAVTRVAIKAATSCYFTPEGTVGSYTVAVDDLPCYAVAGLGTPVVTVSRVGDGPACREISHVEYLAGPAVPPDPGPDGVARGGLPESGA